MARLRTVLVLVVALVGLLPLYGAHAVAPQQRRIPAGWQQVTW